MRKYPYDALTPGQLSDGLNAVGYSANQFARLTGADPKRVLRWLDGSEPNPPLWVGQVLGCLTVEEARRLMEAYAARVVRHRDHLDNDTAS